MGYRMKKANGLKEMVKYAAELSRELICNWNRMTEGNDC